MKHLLLLLLILPTVVKADYKIVFLNTPSIKIDGKELSINDVFSPEATVEWTSPKQAMKVVDTDTGQQRLLVAEQYRKSRAQNVKSYVAGLKHTSSRGEGASVAQLRETLTDHFYLTDSLKVSTRLPIDEQHFFYISYRFNEEEINKMIPNRKGAFYITGDIFTIDGTRIEPFETTLSVYYYDQEKDRVTLVTDSMLVTPSYE